MSIALSLLALCIATLLGLIDKSWAQWSATGPLAYNGSEWKVLDLELENSRQAPVPPVYSSQTNNTIFVAISSFRDGPRW
jgi:hypothetical protein